LVHVPYGYEMPILFNEAVCGCQLLTVG